jgi:hypothetical protein
VLVFHVHRDGEPVPARPRIHGDMVARVAHDLERPSGRLRTVGRTSASPDQYENRLPAASGLRTIIRTRN